ncbi:MAG: DUF4012 domain-containing protein [Caldilinea sp. CFX5]|nr:DUF4012 domain-containing protein [Caldilinea sp. CFX5]
MTELFSPLTVIHLALLSMVLLTCCLLRYIQVNYRRWRRRKTTWIVSAVLASLLCAVQPHTVFAAYIAQQNPVLPMARTILQRMAPAVADSLGMNGPRTYLVLVQNNHELRATGGFISAVGKVTVENGELRELDFIDSYAFFQETLEYGPAPKPMQQYMNVQLLLLRDANWSPDLPTTAKLVQSLYAQQTGIRVNGVIAVDLHAADLLVDALGPLELPGAPTPITGENFAEQIVQLWERPPGTDLEVNYDAEFYIWWGQRKNFVTGLAQAARQRLENGDVSYIDLLRNVRTALRERSIQIWLEEPLLAKQLRLFGWDGGLYSAPGADFVAWVDTNMGFNKADAVLQRELSYSVTWPDGPAAPALATATITYTHPITIANYTCTNTPEYGESYNFLIERCYYDYVRLYTPPGTELVQATGLDPASVVTQRGENRTQYFAGYFILPVGQQHTVSFQYRLPADLTPANYQLLLRRQAGSKPLPVTVTVNGETITTTVTDAKLRWPGP